MAPRLRAYIVLFLRANSTSYLVVCLELRVCLLVLMESKCNLPFTVNYNTQANTCPEDNHTYVILAILIESRNGNAL